MADAVFVEAVRRIEDNDEKLTKLHFQGKRYHDEHAEVLAAVIWPNTHLRLLNLEGNKITDAGAWELSEAIRLNKGLRVLDLRHNYIHSGGSMALLDGLTENTTLEQLILDWSCLDDETGDNLESLMSIESAKENNRSLWSSFVEHTTPTGTQQPTKNGDDFSLYIGNNLAVAEACRRLSKGDKSLRFLNLMEKSLMCAHISAVVKSIEKSSQSNNSVTLQTLNLWNNNIKDPGATAVASIIKVTQIQNLSLRGNKIKEKGAVAIANEIGYNKNLVSLDIRCNSIGNAGSKAIANSIYDTTIGINNNKSNYNGIVELFLSENHIGDIGAKAIAKMYGANTILHVLHLGQNKIGDEGGQAIAEAMGKNRSVQELVLSNNNLTDSTAIHVAKAVEENYSMQRLYLSNKGITRKGEDALLAAGNTKDVHTTVLKCIYVESGNLMSKKTTREDTSKKTKIKTFQVKTKVPMNRADSHDWKKLKGAIRQNSRKNQIKNQEKAEVRNTAKSHAKTEEWQQLRNALEEVSTSPHKRSSIKKKPPVKMSMKLKEIPSFLQKLQPTTTTAATAATTAAAATTTAAAATGTTGTTGSSSVSSSPQQPPKSKLKEIPDFLQKLKPTTAVPARKQLPIPPTRTALTSGPSLSPNSPHTKSKLKEMPDFLQKLNPTAAKTTAAATTTATTKTSPQPSATLQSPFSKNQQQQNQQELPPIPALQHSKPKPQHHKLKEIPDFLQKLQPSTTAVPRPSEIPQSSSHSKNHHEQHSPLHVSPKQNRTKDLPDFLQKLKPNHSNLERKPSFSSLPATLLVEPEKKQKQEEEEEVDLRPSPESKVKLSSGIKVRRVLTPKRPKKTEIDSTASSKKNDEGVKVKEVSAKPKIRNSTDKAATISSKPSKTSNPAASSSNATNGSKIKAQQEKLFSSSAPSKETATKKAIRRTIKKTAAATNATTLTPSNKPAARRPSKAKKTKKARNAIKSLSPMRPTMRRTTLKSKQKVPERFDEIKTFHENMSQSFRVHGVHDGDSDESSDHDELSQSLQSSPLPVRRTAKATSGEFYK